MSVPLVKALTLRPVIRSTDSRKFASHECWKNIRISLTRWSSPSSAILRSAGVRLSSSVHTSVSGPAQSERAFVGPRPKSSL